MEFDDALNAVGGFGRYQKWVFFLICWTSIVVAFHNMAYVFIAGIPDHQCSNVVSDNIHSGVSNGLDQSTEIPNSPGKNVEIRQCEIIQHSWVNSSDNGNTSEVVNTGECQNWDFDTSQFSATIVSKWNLICGRKWMRATTQAIYMTGYLIGCVLFGDLSDRVGRRLTFLIGTLIHVGFGISSAFAPSYPVFTAMWFFVALGTAGAHNAAYILLMEVIGEKYRAPAAAGTDLFWAFGYIGIGAIAYFIRDWVTLQLVLNAPLVLQILYYWLLPESPRWLLMKGRHDEAVSTLRRIAKVNGRSLPEHITLTLATETSEKEAMKGTSGLDLVKTPRLRLRTLNLTFNWFVNALVFYGLAWNVSQLAGNLYLNFTINGAIEVPAYILAVVAVSKTGRRPLICTAMTAGGLACLVLAFVPNDLSWLQTALANVGKFGITISFTMIYLYTAELTPTVIRNVGLGVCAMSSRAGGMAAPYFGMLGELNRSAPQIVFGILAIAAGLLVLALPETFQKPLPDTIEDGENFGSDQSLSCFGGRKKSVTLTENGDYKIDNGTNGSLLQKSKIDNTAI